MTKDKHILKVFLMFCSVILISLYFFCACTQNNQSENNVYKCEITEEGTNVIYSLSFNQSDATLTRTSANSFRSFSGIINYISGNRYVIYIKEVKDNGNIPNFLLKAEITINGSSFQFLNPPPTVSFIDSNDTPVKRPDSTNTGTLPTEGSSDNSNSKPEYTVAPENCAHKNHTTIKGKLPTCLDEGYTDKIFCSDCGVSISSGNPIPALGHTETYISISEKAATCTEKGNTEEKRCKRCDSVLVQSVEIPILDHLPEVTQEKVFPTCTQVGHSEQINCLRCHEILTKSVELQAKGHTFIHRVCNECGELQLTGTYNGYTLENSGGSEAEFFNVKKSYTLQIIDEATCKIYEKYVRTDTAYAEMNVDGDIVNLYIVGSSEYISAPTAEEHGFTLTVDTLGINTTHTYTRKRNGISETYFFELEGANPTSANGTYTKITEAFSEKSSSYEFDKYNHILITETDSYRLDMINDSFEPCKSSLAVTYYLNSRVIKSNVFESTDEDIFGVLNYEHKSLQWYFDSERSVPFNQSEILGKTVIELYAFVEYTDTYKMGEYSLAIPHGQYNNTSFDNIFNSLLSYNLIEICSDGWKKDIKINESAVDSVYIPTHAYELDSDREIVLSILPLVGNIRVEIKDLDNQIRYEYFPLYADFEECTSIDDVLSLLNFEYPDKINYTYEADSLSFIKRTFSGITVTYINADKSYSEKIAAFSTYSIKSFDGISEWFTVDNSYTAENQIEPNQSITLYSARYTVSYYDGNAFVTEVYFNLPFESMPYDGYEFMGFYVGDNLFTDSLNVGDIAVNAKYVKYGILNNPNEENDGNQSVTFLTINGTEENTIVIPKLSSENYEISVLTEPTLLSSGTKEYYNEIYGRYVTDIQRLTRQTVYGENGDIYDVTLLDDSNAQITYNETDFVTQYSINDGIITFIAESETTPTTPSLLYKAVINAAEGFCIAEVDGSETPLSQAAYTGLLYGFEQKSDYMFGIIDSVYQIVDSNYNAISEYGTEILYNDPEYGNNDKYIQESLFMFFADDAIYISLDENAIPCMDGQIDFEGYDDCNLIYVSNGSTLNVISDRYELRAINNNVETVYSGEVIYDEASKVLFLYDGFTSSDTEQTTFVYTVTEGVAVMTITVS